MIDWKVGDEFKIIDTNKDWLGSCTGVYTIAYIDYHPDRNQNWRDDPENYVWFRVEDTPNRGSCFVSRSNIRKLTKLEKALK